jgi:hypothetical protein
MASAVPARKRLIRRGQLGFMRIVTILEGRGALGSPSTGIPLCTARPLIFRKCRTGRLLAI